MAEDKSKYNDRNAIFNPTFETRFTSAEGQCTPSFLKLLLSEKSVCVCVHAPRLLKTIHVK